MVDFLNAIEQGTAVTPNFHDGVKGMHVLEAGLQAAESGSRVMLGDSQDPRSKAGSKVV